MTDDQKKKPSAGFWVTVALVVVLVAYPLSFGPACWITSRTNVGADAVAVHRADGKTASLTPGSSDA